MFLSVGFWLFDLPHLIVSSIKRCVHNSKQKEELAADPNYVEKPFIDTYAFELGYHMSYGLVVSAIGILFSIIVPYIAMLCVAFFLFKYYVDKYNLSFVYNSEF